MFKTIIPKEEDIEEPVIAPVVDEAPNGFSLISSSELSDKVLDIVDLYPQLSNKVASITTILEDTYSIKVPRYRVIEALESIYPYHQF